MFKLAGKLDTRELCNFAREYGKSTDKSEPV